MPAIHLLLVDSNLNALSDYRRALTGENCPENGFTVPGDQIAISQSPEEAVSIVTTAAEGEQPICVGVIEAGEPPDFRGVAALKRMAAIDPGLQFILVAGQASWELERRLRESVSPRRVILMTKPVRPQEVRINVAAMCDQWRLVDTFNKTKLEKESDELLSIGDLEIAVARFDHKGRLRVVNEIWRELYPELSELQSRGVRIEEIEASLRQLCGGSPHSEARAGLPRVLPLDDHRRILPEKNELSDGDIVWFHVNALRALEEQRQLDGAALVQAVTARLVNRESGTVDEVKSDTVVALEEAKHSSNEPSAVRKALLRGDTLGESIDLDVRAQLREARDAVLQTGTQVPSLITSVNQQVISAPEHELQVALRDLLLFAVQHTSEQSLQIALDVVRLGRNRPTGLPSLPSGRYVRLSLHVPVPRRSLADGYAIFVPDPGGIDAKIAGECATAYALANRLNGQLAVSQADDAVDATLIELYLPVTQPAREVPGSRARPVKASK